MDGFRDLSIEAVEWPDIGTPAKKPKWAIVPHIVREADKLDADLIVVGREPGDGGLKAALLGSTPRKVTLMATRPVLMVPMGSESDWGDKQEA